MVAKPMHLVFDLAAVETDQDQSTRAHLPCKLHCLRARIPVVKNQAASGGKSCPRFSRDVRETVFLRGFRALRPTLPGKTLSVSLVDIPPLPVTGIEEICVGIESETVVDDDDRPAFAEREIGLSCGWPTRDDDGGASFVSKFHSSPLIISTSPTFCS